MDHKYVPPEFKKTAFQCPYCHIYTQQDWAALTPPRIYPRAWRSMCFYCDEMIIWVEEMVEEGSNEKVVPRMIYPDIPQGPPPHEDMPKEIKADYLEALSIVNKSPRGAAALLRLALQKLLKELGERGGNINKDIESLIEKGLPREIQIALDTVRVIGNQAVHPGVLDLRDDRETAMELFEIMNYIVEKTIAQEKKREEFIGKFPKSIQDLIRRTKAR